MGRERGGRGGGGGGVGANLDIDRISEGHWGAINHFKIIGVCWIMLLLPTPPPTPTPMENVKRF